MKFFFPDVNVWVALIYGGHQHHGAATGWFESLRDDGACLCRFTQVSLLRLITHPAVMGREVRTQAEAWATYDVLVSDRRVLFQSEVDPEQLEVSFRKLTSSRHSSSQQWPDAYLAAFAQTAGLILVTFDRGLRRLAGENSLLLA